MGFVKARSDVTGREQMVPEHWFDNPLLSRGLSRIGESSSDEQPNDSWKNDRIKKYAEDHSIDLGDATKKVDMLAVIDEAQPKPDNPALNAIGVAHGGPGGETAPDQVTTPTETPATGENQE